MNVEACAKVNASDLISFVARSDTYYTRLPTDALDIEWDVAPNRDFDTLCKLVAEDSSVLTDTRFMDDVLIAAFRQAQQHEALAATTDWPAVQLATARVYAQYLAIGEAGRPIRMRAGRLGFFLADLIDRPNPTKGKISRTLSARNPWDWIDDPHPFWIDCADRNVHFSDGRTMAFGKPTQIDRCGERLALGSCYSPGGYLIDEAGNCEFLDRPLPIVLAATHPALGRIEVMQNGYINLENGLHIGTMNCARVWRARLVDDNIYASDWSEVGTLFRFSLKDRKVDRIACAPVMICNDVVAHFDGFALLDKFQGHVFFFDANWRYLRAVMAFGNAPGRLFDPISLKSNETGDLKVVNWINGEMTEWHHDQ